jgi:hypothetical protein
MAIYHLLPEGSTPFFIENKFYFCIAFLLREIAWVAGRFNGILQQDRFQRPVRRKLRLGHCMAAFSQQTVRSPEANLWPWVA